MEKILKSWLMGKYTDKIPNEIVKILKGEKINGRYH